MWNGRQDIEHYQRSNIEPWTALGVVGVFPLNAAAVRALGGRGEVLVVDQHTPLIRVRRADLPQTGP